MHGGDGAGVLEVSAQTALNGTQGPFRLDVRLSAAQGEFVAICGPSGAGKTTLLRIVAGLARPQAGRVVLGGEVWCDTARSVFLPVRRRNIGFVFQDYALFPNMTARRNVEYALARHPRAQRRAQAEALLELAGLRALADHRPARLSGGQRQRLALIRALARRPALLMLDEPLSALDPGTRATMQGVLRDLVRAFGATTLMVSHDMAEVAMLADRVVRLEAGQVLEDAGARGGADG
ncbi:ABC transporter ATP-binding protein [Verticiella sediminum]|uniref:ABC transporter ATP-binding protein n=1 Tax=Verticiella sediminum TaxID=1247510 RepID=A0A556AJE8_9BURK|nr:ABC transporter ATP-binding protein [Verticiella sediminum]TSH92985.1 ABC transporter ATP-binding protein [Verticiella sediminum]